MSIYIFYLFYNLCPYVYRKNNKNNFNKNKKKIFRKLTFALFPFSKSKNCNILYAILYIFYIYKQKLYKIYMEKKKKYIYTYMNIYFIYVPN